ncbi:hypothetical protein [Paenibacillus alkalitolerans]|uniref:hypothetical protein n=1 Tax=Paenibacillus alkalitolerans TaxID=2799335 RepID=UPI0018F6B28B|nr:hypothetical protein [Paenibacillus alkalitolerans]
MIKQFIIEVDQIHGTVDYKNPDDLTYFEVLGAIEYTKLIVTKNFLEDTED